jgi:hypothetical protein
MLIKFSIITAKGEIRTHSLRYTKLMEIQNSNDPWRSVVSVEFAVLKWVDWFNNRRLLEQIEKYPPNEFEMMYYERQEVTPVVVGLNKIISGKPRVVQNLNEYTIHGDY